MLDNKAKKLLKKAGWYEGRKIDITNYVRSLEDSGYEVFDAAREFLEEYGELEFVLNYEFEGEIRSDEHSTEFKELNFYYGHHSDYDEKVGEKKFFWSF